jgi:hypothetical protein
MEKAGGVTFSESQRRFLHTLADFWLGDLRQRRSARPGAFRKRLDEMTNAFTHALAAIRLNDLDATELDRHLLHWLLEAPNREALGALGALESQLEVALKTVADLKACLPQDPGKPRPYGDERRLNSLADIFEATGGVASVYSDSEGRIANTPFRRFAQEFYRDAKEWADFRSRRNTHNTHRIASRAYRLSARPDGACSLSKSPSRHQ